MKRFADKIAVITGGGSGIGLATAERLAAEGAHVILADIDAARIAEAAAAIAAKGGSAAASVLDVTDQGQVERLMTEAFSGEGRPSILVNCAGVLLAETVLELSTERMRRLLDVNVTGTAGMVHAFAKRFTQADVAGWGAVVNIASISGFRGNYSRTAYGASKGAVVVMTRVMAVELAPHRIRVNAVAPGPVDTPMVRAGHGEGTRAAFNATVPLARYAEPEEIAAAIAFLACDEASYVTGHVLAVDGGWLAAGIMSAG
ncbi:MAG: glucose 1-dehydrogenase [Hyphomicrobiaceae bacterium]|nr:glucose 1-dehydrogenase [Hyphomicrobiaceae bacterium]